MSVCVHPHVHVWACLASSACVSNTTRLWWTTLDVCESLLAEHNSEQPCLPLQLETKKSHSQEATLKYQVLIWQIQATGVFTFQRLRGEKDQMPPLSSSAAASIEASLTSPWVTDLCVCVCVSHGRRKGIERAMCKVIKHHMTTCSRET